MAGTKRKLARAYWILSILVTSGSCFVSCHQDESEASVFPKNTTALSVQFSLLLRTLIMHSIIFTNLFYIFYVINSVENCQCCKLCWAGAVHFVKNGLSQALGSWARAEKRGRSETKTQEELGEEEKPFLALILPKFSLVSENFMHDPMKRSAYQWSTHRRTPGTFGLGVRLWVDH